MNCQVCENKIEIPYYLSVSDGSKLEVCVNCYKDLSG